MERVFKGFSLILKLLLSLQGRETASAFVQTDELPVDTASNWYKQKEQMRFEINETEEMLAKFHKIDDGLNSKVLLNIDRL